MIANKHRHLFFHLFTICIFFAFAYYLVPCQNYTFISFFYSSAQGLNFLTSLNDIFVYYIRSISPYPRKEGFPSLWHLSFPFVVSALHLNLQVVNFQRCEHALTCPNTPQFMCLAYCQVPTSSTSGCASTYCTVQYYIEYSRTVIQQHLYFKPRLSGSKRQSSDDAAGNTGKLQLLYCSIVLFKVLNCKIKKCFFFFKCITCKKKIKKK